MTSEPGYWDVAVIGAGVVGTAIARALAPYDLRCVLLDGAADVGTGTSKANTAILHTGFDAKPGTLESRLLTRGSGLLQRYAGRAGIAVERTGAVLVAWTAEQVAALPAIAANARRNGYQAVRELPAAQVYEREPALGPGALAGLAVPDESIIDPWTVPLAFATEAVRAGVTLRLETRVTGVARVPGGPSGSSRPGRPGSPGRPRAAGGPVGQGGPDGRDSRGELGKLDKPGAGRQDGVRHADAAGGPDGLTRPDGSNGSNGTGGPGEPGGPGESEAGESEEPGGWGRLGEPGVPGGPGRSGGRAGSDGSAWPDGGFELATTRGPVRCGWAVNAAGLGSDEVDRMFGGEGFTIRPRKGELIVYDKLARPLVNSIVLPVPTARTKGVLVAPTVFGNVLLGPTATDVPDRNDRSTTAEGLSSLLAAGARIVPGLAGEEVTATYAGLRAATEHTDYQIGVFGRYARVAGIRSTGLSASLGIAEYVIALLTDAGLPLRPRPSRAAHRPPGERAAFGRAPDRPQCSDETPSPAPDRPRSEAETFGRTPTTPQGRNEAVNRTPDSPHSGRETLGQTQESPQRRDEALGRGPDSPPGGDEAFSQGLGKPRHGDSVDAFERVPTMPYLGEARARPYRDPARIAADPAYGEIVCHCERVSRGEIRDALASDIPPAGLDGLRRRTRAVNGRCQGFYCAATISRLLRDASTADGSTSDAELGDASTAGTPGIELGAVSPADAGPAAESGARATAENEHQ